MATKYQYITDVYEATVQKITGNPAVWTAFLRSACRNYKCRFDEQVLIYAQRPDATAVLEIEKWNKQFGRWVNKGAKGIAVFDDGHNGNYRLKHYFDVSDTHGSRFERSVPIWQMRPEFDEEVIESLENSFGGLDDNSTLPGAIISAAKNAVEDNMADYLRDLMHTREDSFLEELDDLNVEVEYRTALQNSVAYMMMVRCGIDAGEYFETDDFRHIADFNTRDTANALGLASSDIAEMCLREIAATVLNLQRGERNSDRTVANRENPEHTARIIQNDERGAEHGSVDLSDGGRLPSPEPGRAGGRAGSPWQIRVAPKEIPETAPPRPVRGPADGRDAQRTPDGDRAGGAVAAGIDDRASGGGAGRDGGTESVRPDEVGGADEQHPALSGGSDTPRPDIRIKPLPTEAQQLNILGEVEEEKPSAFSMESGVPQDVIDEQLVRNSGGGIFQPRFRIYHNFRQLNSEDEIIKFLKGEYGHGGGRSRADSSYWVESSSKGLSFKIDSYPPGAVYTLSWANAAKRIRQLIGTDKYITTQEREQLYPQYLEYLDQQATLREKERFIDSMATVPPAEKRDTLSLRLSDFISGLGRYEKGYLGEYGLSDIADAANAGQIDALLKDPQRVEQLIAALAAIKGETTSIFARNNAWRFSEELAVLFPRQHIYHLGDTLYIGTHEYEMLAFDENTVRLFDPLFPLVNQEMPRDEFDRNLRGRRLNDRDSRYADR